MALDGAVLGGCRDGLPVLHAVAIVHLYYPLAHSLTHSLGLVSLSRAVLAVNCLPGTRSHICGTSWLRFSCSQAESQRHTLTKHCAAQLGRCWQAQAGRCQKHKGWQLPESGVHGVFSTLVAVGAELCVVVDRIWVCLLHPPGRAPPTGVVLFFGVNCRLLCDVCWLLLHETQSAESNANCADFLFQAALRLSSFTPGSCCQWVVVEVSEVLLEVSEVSLYPYVLIALVSACRAAACSHPVIHPQERNRYSAPGMPLYGVCAVIPAVFPCAWLSLLLTVRMLGMPCCWRPPLLVHQQLGSVLCIRASQSAAFVVVHR